MKTEQGVIDYPLPQDFTNTKAVFVVLNDGLRRELLRISAAEMDEYYSHIMETLPYMAVPVCYCVTDEMILAPPPDGEYDIETLA